jgi:hypothetical protein
MDLQDLTTQPVRLIPESIDSGLNYPPLEPPPVFNHTPIQPPTPQFNAYSIEPHLAPSIERSATFSPLIETRESSRYQSTPWSERVPSQSPLTRTTTQSPSAESVLSTQNRTTNRLITEGDKLLLLRIAYKFRELYGRITMGKFWTTVAKELSKQTGYPERKNLSRNVTLMIKQRKDFLEALESGEQDSPSSYTEALDSWISVVDAYRERKDEEADAQGRLAGESEASKQWRLNQLSRYSDKTTLAISNRRNKRSRGLESDLEDEDEGEKDEEESLDITARPPRRRRRIEQNESDLDSVLVNSVVKLSDYIVEKGGSKEINQENIIQAAKEVAKEAIKEVDIRVWAQIDSLQSGIQEVLNLIRRGN